VRKREVPIKNSDTANLNMKLKTDKSITTAIGIKSFNEVRRLNM